jgi:hypothetical protein
MSKKNDNKNAITSSLKKSSIVTFVQMPPSPPSFEKKDKKAQAPPDGVELFSMFTANIIKEDVIFTR